MVATTAVAIGRLLPLFRSSSSHLGMRLFSSSSSLTRAPHLPGFSRPVWSTVSLSHPLRVLAPAAIRLNSIRCRANFSKSHYETYFRVLEEGDPCPKKLKPRFSGCDYEHWMIVMKKPFGEGLTKQEMIDCYVKTLAKVLGSEEEAKQKIYNISCDRYFGFGCEVDEETSKKIKRLPEVHWVVPDSYVDDDNKDYGGELYVNGKIVERSPERQKRVAPPPKRPQRDN